MTGGRFTKHLSADEYTDLLAQRDELLAACRIAREELVFGGDWATARTALDKAIARVEGGQHGRH